MDILGGGQVKKTPCIWTVNSEREHLHVIVVLFTPDKKLKHIWTHEYMWLFYSPLKSLKHILTPTCGCSFIYPWKKLKYIWTNTYMWLFFYSPLEKVQAYLNEHLHVVVHPPPSASNWERWSFRRSFSSGESRSFLKSFSSFSYQSKSVDTSHKRYFSYKTNL